jgi:uncharacterized protein involved in exopolysaccharide biosynthesis
MNGPPGERPGAPVYVVAGYGPEEEVDLRDYLRVIVGRWRFIAGFVAACTLLSVVVALLLPREYRAVAVLAPVRDEGSGDLGGVMSQLGGLASLAGLQAAPSDPTAERMAILTSRAFTTELVRDNHLMPELFADQWDAARGAWKVDEDKVPSDWDAFRKFKGIRQVNMDTKTGLVTLSIDWTDPEVAARWVRLHVAGVNRRVQADAVREAERSIAYLMEQVAKTSNVELRATLFNLVEAQTKKAMLARARDDYAFRVVDPPVAPDKPDHPRRRVIVSLALVGSAVVAVFGALLLEYLRPRKPKDGPAAPPTEPPAAPPA